MIELEDGLSLCGRCILGHAVGYIISVGQRTYSIRWLDGEITTQLRPDCNEDEDRAADALAAKWDHDSALRNEGAV